MGHKSNLSKLDRRGLKKKEKIIFWGGETRFWSVRESEKVREKENKNNKKLFLRFTEFCRLKFIKQRVKVHLL